jgi:hypothetical protein
MSSRARLAPDSEERLAARLGAMRLERLTGLGAEAIQARVGVLALAERRHMPALVLQSVPAFAVDALGSGSYCVL